VADLAATFAERNASMLMLAIVNALSLTIAE
jgi:hypothetical protein